MSRLFLSIVSILKITLLDLTLSGDNIGIIAMATKNLPGTYAKRASKIGISLAVALIIFFECFVTIIISVKWLPIKLIGGLILAKITWDFIKPHDEDAADVKVADKFLEAILIIVIADLSMSLDNVLAIAGAANGSVMIIILGVALNIPILIFGSQFVSKLMKKHPMVVYLGGAVLAHTSVMMIIEDPYTGKFIPQLCLRLLPWSIAALVLAYGYKMIQKEKNRDNIVLEQVNVTLIEEVEENNSSNINS